MVCRSLWLVDSRPYWGPATVLPRCLYRVFPRRPSCADPLHRMPSMVDVPGQKSTAVPQPPRPAGDPLAAHDGATPERAWAAAGWVGRA